MDTGWSDQSSEPGPPPQMTYSLTRFAIYETMRDYMAKDNKGPLPFYNKVLLGGISGEHWVVRARAGQRPRTRAIRP